MRRCVFCRAIELVPNFGDAHTNLGNIYCHKGMFREAIQEHKNGLRLSNNPSSKLDAYNNLGDVYFTLKQFKESLHYLNKALAISQSEWEVYQGIGLSYQGLGEWDKAKMALDKALSIHQGISVQSALRLVDQRRWSDPHIEKIIKSTTENVPLSVSIGDTLSLSDRTKNCFDGFNDVSECLIFFVGAGISYPSPSNLPLAEQVIKRILQTYIDNRRKKNPCAL